MSITATSCLLSGYRCRPWPRRQYGQPFRDETELVAVRSHLNIVPIFEIGEGDEYYYQTMRIHPLSAGSLLTCKKISRSRSECQKFGKVQLSGVEWQ